MKTCTLCFPLRKAPEPQVLLGLKKPRLNAGKWSGFGGKVEEGETLEQAALRELFEESSLQASPKSLEHVAELNFTFTVNPAWNQVVHVFLTHDFEGEPSESDEMLPKWFHFNEIPFEAMWKDDPHWLPLVLDGKKLKARFSFGSDNASVASQEVTIVDSL
ncbi:8-oxo-dGTP diphosphatase [Candidatus Micrarchaeota archaeon]|nr:8-oxo-dGTP diphosphatase [Candidatus Micrarchaeota archaeon]